MDYTMTAGFEPDGIYTNLLKDLTRVEGTYLFHAVATYGAGVPRDARSVLVNPCGAGN